MQHATLYFRSRFISSASCVPVTIPNQRPQAWKGMSIPNLADSSCSNWVWMTKRHTQQHKSNTNVNIQTTCREAPTDILFVCLKYLQIPKRQWVPIEGVSLLLNYSSSWEKINKIKLMKCKIHMLRRHSKQTSCIYMYTKQHRMLSNTIWRAVNTASRCDLHSLAVTYTLVTCACPTPAHSLSKNLNFQTGDRCFEMQQPFI